MGVPGQCPPLPGLLPPSTLCRQLPVPKLSALAWDEKKSQISVSSCQMTHEHRCSLHPLASAGSRAPELPMDCLLSPRQAADSLHSLT